MLKWGWRLHLPLSSSPFLQEAHVPNCQHTWRALVAKRSAVIMICRPDWAHALPSICLVFVLRVSRCLWPDSPPIPPSLTSLFFNSAKGSRIPPCARASSSSGHRGRSNPLAFRGSLSRSLSFCCQAAGIELWHVVVTFQEPFPEIQQGAQAEATSCQLLYDSHVNFLTPHEMALLAWSCFA